MPKQTTSNNIDPTGVGLSNQLVVSEVDNMLLGDVEHYPTLHTGQACSSNQPVADAVIGTCNESNFLV